MIVDGRTVAKEILEQVRVNVAALSRTPIVRAISVSPTPASKSYLKIKAARATDAGMRLEVVELNDSATTEEVIEAVQKGGVDAVIVQLPLPSHIDTHKVVNAIPFMQDADVLSDDAKFRFENEGIVPPVAEAMRELFERYDISPADTYAVVLGEGELVGKPCATLLEKMGARVLTMNIDTWHPEHLKDADIVVCGVGKAGLVQPEMLKEGVVLIDAGASEVEGAIKGDCDPRCADIASVFTPVPGGMGPIVVACLFRNVATLSVV